MGSPEHLWNASGLLFLQLQDREGKRNWTVGFLFCFSPSVGGELLGGETHSKSTNGKVNKESLHSRHVFCFLFHVKEDQ